MVKQRTRKVPGMLKHSSGQARVVLSGQVFYLGREGTAGAATRYAELVARWEAGGRKPLAPAPNVEQALLTVRELCSRYTSFLDSTSRYAKNGVPTSQRAIVQIAIDEFCERFGDLRLLGLTETHVVQHRDILEGRKRLTRRGINRKIGCIRAVLRWGFQRGLLKRDQWLGVSAIGPLSRAEAGNRDHKRAKRAVSAEDVEKVAAVCTRQVGAMLRLQALTGARPGEICAMRWVDIDQTPVIVEGVTCWTYNVVDGKTAHHGHSTQYALGPKAQAILEGFKAAPTAHIFSPCGVMAELHDERRAARQKPVTDYTRKRDMAATRVFDHLYDVVTYRQAIERACERAEVQRFTPHEVRHGFVTRAAKRFGVYAASVAANHSRVATTEGYLHRDRSEAFRVVVELEREPISPKPPQDREAVAG